ncbi:MAG: hypothetical protein M1162_04270 [Candidatus Thermoplasmatota archaeon]|nr:hypothetical protein [Candidatus Thermoplasmatota archaeon]
MRITNSLSSSSFRSIPISQYSFNRSLYGMGYGNSTLPLTSLNESCMPPFALNVPVTWNFGYYNNLESGYSRIG